ncbi:MAG: 1,4-beta-glucanase [Ruminococcus sp.]|nr:1,4-beta-glucanase [Ruminococcus sp.]
MEFIKRTISGICAAVFIAGAALNTGMLNDRKEDAFAAATSSIESQMKWGTLKIGGGGFVSAVVTGQSNMYARTDVGGAYRYNYDTQSWEQLFGFLTDEDRGLLSVSGIAIDPTDDDTAYFLCGCAYFSGARTEIIKTTDGGKTFTRTDVTDMIQVHGNGDGRECSEPIAIDPDDPDTIYAGGDVTFGDSCLIKSTDGGKTWNPVKGYDDLGLYKNNIKWPAWNDSHIVRACEDGAYNTQNGVAVIRILDGKVYVGTSIKGSTNIHVASVKDDKFTALSKDLPTANYPVSISYDGAGNLFFTYIQGLAFAGGAGGIFKYNIASGKVTDVSPSGNAFGTVSADKNDPNKLVTRTCGVWSAQWYSEKWTDESVAWGDWFYRSEDGGATWENITPGTKAGEYTDDEHFVSLPMSTGGYDWIYKKACHWGSSIVLDPNDPDKIIMTSGNGVFACDNVWDERGVQFYFHPDGIEEVVALDFVSTADGLDLSAIGDYDGYQHLSPDEIGIQYKPNMGSTSAIAVCPQNTDVWVRLAEGDNDVASAFYTTDRGKTWNKMDAAVKGGKLAVSETGSGKYRIFNTGNNDGNVSYSDDWGKTWSKCEGIPSQYGSKPTMLLVEPDDPDTVYAYATYYNSSWGYSKPAPTADDAQYKFCVSTDGGKTFTSTDICMYDQCDSAGRIGYLGKGELMLGGGWYGMYHVTVSGGKPAVEKLDNVYYCKTLGYGAPEKEGGVNTIYFYGKPDESDPEGIYRSTDAGKTWVCINTEHIYGGTGNGNFLVGDMNEFGKVYMSTVGCGIVYGMLSDSTEPPVTTTGASGKTMYGDANEDTKVNMADAVAVLQSLANSTKYPLTAQGAINADCDGSVGLTGTDAITILRVESGEIKQTELPLK